MAGGPPPGPGRPFPPGTPQVGGPEPDGSLPLPDPLGVDIRRCRCHKSHFPLCLTCFKSIAQGQLGKRLRELTGTSPPRGFRSSVAKKESRQKRASYQKQRDWLPSASGDCHRHQHSQRGVHSSLPSKSRSQCIPTPFTGAKIAIWTLLRVAGPEAARRAGRHWSTSSRVNEAVPSRVPRSLNDHCYQFRKESHHPPHF
jgi:hypothetical protein